MNEYEQGWNLRIAGPNQDWEPRPPVNLSLMSPLFRQGFIDCDNAYTKAIAESIRTNTDVIYPKPFHSKVK